MQKGFFVALFDFFSSTALIWVSLWMMLTNEYFSSTFISWIDWSTWY